MNRQHLDDTIAALETEKRIIDQSIVKLKALRDESKSVDAISTTAIIPTRRPRVDH